MYNIYHYQW